jgi:beta-aspartyl-peptidase (threonine type)
MTAEDETKAVRRVLDRQVYDWNHQDLESFLAGYWHSPELVFQTGADRINGWEAVRDRYRARYKGDGKQMGKLAFDGLEVFLLSGPSALARGRWQVTMTDGQSHSGVFTLIFRKVPEGWRIIHDHTSGT